MSAGPQVNPFVTAFQEMIEWHAKAAEIVKFVSGSSPQGAAEDNHKLPVALLPAGYSLTHSDRAAILASGRDHYEFVDHWQWTGSLWRGIPGPDLVIYVTHAQGPGPVGEEEGVEVKAPGLMVVKARVGEALSEKTDRRLGFEVVEWVRGGAFWSF
jgi:HMG box factor